MVIVSGATAVGPLFPCVSAAGSVPGCEVCDVCELVGDGERDAMCEANMCPSDAWRRLYVCFLHAGPASLTAAS